MSTHTLNHKIKILKKERFCSGRVFTSQNALFLILILWVTGCATSLPEERHHPYHYPEKLVYVDEPTGEYLGRPYEVLGWVRAREHFPTLEQDPNSQKICINYYNKAASDLLKEAKKPGGNAVIKVRSVVMLLDGKTEEHSTAECSDDGAEGEILVRGIAIKWKPLSEEEKKKRSRN